MPAFAWDEKYALDHAELDQQHQQLFALLNELYDAMQEGRGPQVVDGVMARLVTFSDYHFEYEEKLMHECGYPGEAHHRAEHDRLRAQTREVTRHCGPDATLAAFKFLMTDWLAQHFAGSDLKLLPYFRARAASTPAPHESVAAPALPRAALPRS